MRRPSLPAADLFTSGNEPDSTPVRDFPEQDMHAQDSAANTQEELEVTNIPEEESFNPNIFVRETGTSEPDGIPAVQEELLPGSIPYEEEEYLPVQNNPVELHLESRGIPDRSGASGSDDPSDEDYIGTDHVSGLNIIKSRSDTLYEPRQKKKHWLKPRVFVIGLVVVSLLVTLFMLLVSGNYQERLASPLTVKGQSISNAEFSFVYHYILVENGVDIFKSGTNEQLSSQGEDGFATYREYFLDMAAREIQLTQILYDDAASKGYSVNDSEKQMAQAYIDWLSGKAKAIGVDLDTYIKGYFGTYVTEDLIRDTLTRIYFTQDYANGAKLNELAASDAQAEEAYSANSYQYDQVSYRVLRIVFEQTDDSFKATAHLRAQEIIDGIGHDESKFESVASNYFTGEAKAKILQTNSTLVPDVRYADISDQEWRTWLFDSARQPGDCTIFDDDNGFPILICFSSRSRQTEPLRDIRFFYINREDTASRQAGIAASDILPTAQTIFDSITDEASVQTLETTYADEILSKKMKAVHDADTYKGVLSDELDSWIFDAARVPGDKTMIETDTQIIIAYYVGASDKPEWYDRVNSYIRMNNYQAFLLEKETEYPYKFNDDGLQYIKDVSTIA